MSLGENMENKLTPEITKNFYPGKRIGRLKEVDRLHIYVNGYMVKSVTGDSEKECNSLFEKWKVEYLNSLTPLKEDK